MEKESYSWKEKSYYNFHIFPYEKILNISVYIFPLECINILGIYLNLYNRMQKGGVKYINDKNLYFTQYNLCSF